MKESDGNMYMYYYSLHMILETPKSFPPSLLYTHMAFSGFASQKLYF